MSDNLPVSGYLKTERLVYFARMCSKARLMKKDLEILEWCYVNGRRPNNEEVFIWNLFMEKRGWRDDDSELVQREKESIGLGNRAEIQTLFDFYDFDEGRRQ